MTKIKICGLFRLDDADYINEALPDYVGFVFAPSRRQVLPRQAEDIKKRLDSRIQAAGVFTNAPVDEIAALINNGVIDLVQLHGDEDAAYIARLKSVMSAPVIKAVRAQSPGQIRDAQSFDCDYLLLDTWQKDGYGGSGKAFDWALIPPLKKRWFLAGGIGVGNVKDALEKRPYGIDISSGAETNGIKDRNKIIELVRMVRSDHL